MYLLVMSELRTELRTWLNSDTPLGSLGYAGILVGTTGTGFASLRRLPVVALVLLVEGGGRYRDSWGADERLAPGDCLCLPAGCPHQYGPEPGDQWTEVFCTFRGAPFDAWFSPQSPTRPARVLHLGEVDRWLPQWLSIHGKTAGSPQEAVRVLADIHLLLNEVMGAPSTTPDDRQRLEETRHLVESWPSHLTPDWERLARMCQVSYETWRKRFRATYGEPPARHRRRVLMRQAGDLLRQTRLTNEQLAEHFGCADAFHFSKSFKAIHGVSPAVWRRR